MLFRLYKLQLWFLYQIRVIYFMMYCVEIWMGANEEHRGLISPVVYLTFFNVNLNELIKKK